MLGARGHSSLGARFCTGLRVRLHGEDVVDSADEARSYDELGRFDVPWCVTHAGKRTFFIAVF